jgi:hypothetical protein
LSKGSCAFSPFVYDDDVNRSEHLPKDPLGPGNPRGPLLRKKTLVEVAEGTAGFYTAGELLERAGITIHEFRVLVSRKILLARYKLKKRGWALYTDSDVLLARRTLEEKLASELGASKVPKTLRELRKHAKLLRRRHRDPKLKLIEAEYTRDQFKKFTDLMAEGKSRVDVYNLTGWHPDFIKNLSREYDKLGGFYVDGHFLEIINRLPIVGVELPIVDAYGLLTLLQHLTKERTCASCGIDGPSERCDTCNEQRAKKRLLRELEASKRRAETPPRPSTPPDPEPSSAAAQ